MPKLASFAEPEDEERALPPGMRHFGYVVRYYDLEAEKKLRKLQGAFDTTLALLPLPMTFLMLSKSPTPALVGLMILAIATIISIPLSLIRRTKKDSEHLVIGNPEKLVDALLPLHLASPSGIELTRRELPAGITFEHNGTPAVVWRKWWKEQLPEIGVDWAEATLLWEAYTPEKLSPEEAQALIRASWPRVR